MRHNENKVLPVNRLYFSAEDDFLLFYSPIYFWKFTYVRETPPCEASPSSRG